jgi:hypothetical protein
MDRNQIRRAISVWAADQVNTCDSAQEQRVFIEEFIKVAVGLGIARLRRLDQKEKRQGIDELSKFVAQAMAGSAAKLMALKSKDKE